MNWTKRKSWLSLPALGRRSFLRIGVAGYAALMSGCWSRVNRTGSTRSFLLMGQREWVSSVCLLCPSACAIRAYFEREKIVAVGGDPDDPNTGGKMCPLGLSVLNLHTSPDRLTQAFRKGPDGQMAPARDEGILGLIAGQIRSGKTLHIHGRITPYAFQLSKMLPAVCHLDPASEGRSAYPSFLNTEGRPPVLDFENARIALLFDTNILEHGYPYAGYVRRITEARLRGMRLVTFSPFLTNTATAGEWIPIRSHAAASLACLAIAREALNDPALRLSALPPAIADSLRSLDGTFLENAAGLSHEAVQDLSRRFFSEPGPAVADLADPSVLLLNIMKGNLNRPGGLLHPGRRILSLDADPGDIAQVLRDSRNVVLLHRSNPAFSRHAEIRPILLSSGRATVVCVDSFMSETAELSDYVLPLASPLETLSLAEPLPLGQPFVVAAMPAAKPGAPSRSFDDWLSQLTAAIHGSSSSLTPERFAAETALGDPNGKLAADRSVYPMQPRPQRLEARMPDIAVSLQAQIKSLPELAECRAPLGNGQYFLTTFEESVQGPGAAPSKWLNEITYSPKICLHPRHAGRHGIRGGDRVVLSDAHGNSAEGTALLFEGVHPDALAIPLHHGHTGYGRVARGESFTDPQDPDMSRIFWGKNRGINPAEISGPAVTIRKKRG